MTWQPLLAAVVPRNSVKPGLKKQSSLRTFFGSDVRAFRGPIVVGIREISRPLTFKIELTVLQHAPVDSIATLRLCRRRVVDTSSLAGPNHSVLVEMIGSSVRSEEDSEEEEFQRIIEATLLADGSGELTRHPYVHRQLDRLLARWAYKLMTGGGLKLPAFALADDGVLYLDDDGKVRSAADWMPKDKAIASSTSKQSLCVRYPVRMKEDLLPMTHLGMDETAELLSRKEDVSLSRRRLASTTAQLTLKGTYTLHSETAKLNGGDFDFDWVCAIEATLSTVRGGPVCSCGCSQSHEEYAYERSKSPWFNLEFVALKTRGNQIGVITEPDELLRAADRLDLLYELVARAQKKMAHSSWCSRRSKQAAHSSDGSGIRALVVPQDYQGGIQL